MSGIDKQYGIILIDESRDGLARKESLYLVLRLAYALSAFIHFVFPMNARTVQKVDSAFDKVLSKAPINSKGIEYTKDISECEVVSLLGNTTFLLTNSLQMCRTALETGLPHAFVSQDHQQPQYIEFNYLDKVGDEELRESLTRCLRQYQNGSHQFERSAWLSRQVISSNFAQNRSPENWFELAKSEECEEYEEWY